MQDKLVRISTVPMSLNVLLKGQLKFLNSYFRVIAISGSGKDLDEIRSREKVNVYAIAMEREISPIRDFVSLVRLYLYFKCEKPRIIHSITPKAGLLAMLAGKLARVPIRIHTFTGLIFPSKRGLMQRLLIAMDRLLCWSATHIYPEGEGVKKDLISYQITDKPLRVLANGNVNGIDTLHFSPAQVQNDQKMQLRQELGVLPDDFVFVFVGRLVGDKGINELVSAFSESDIPKAKLLLVGGEERDLDPLKAETITEMERNPNIISVGFQKDVRPYLAISHCLAFPSYREGFPNVVMQAGAMGLPSIVSDINGCNEIVIEGENGLIVPVKNQSELKNAMCRIWEDSTLYQRLRENSRRLITSRYEQSVVWDALLEEYHTILKAKC